MRRFFAVFVAFLMLFLVVSCGKSEDAKKKFRDWGVRDERTVPKAPSFLDGYEKEYGNRHQDKDGARK